MLIPRSSEAFDGEPGGFTNSTVLVVAKRLEPIDPSRVLRLSQGHGSGDAQIGQVVREQRRHSLATIGLESRKAESRLAHHLPSWILKRGYESGLGVLTRESSERKRGFATHLPIAVGQRRNEVIEDEGIIELRHSGDRHFTDCRIFVPQRGRATPASDRAFDSSPLQLPLAVESLAPDR